ncbi:small subunit of acetolactate synthase-domain-containing protein [Radiomyces spectabilis]|uniref:small subunit of acetolactate synthase-domain-containing protein n=1 Tax=Radiomyces spectabilis TaxID=64574 RepID=UPI00221F37AB|nr:small subunit of acetolactate synthase-domain-containing protein [Radiomyces spectabilis]KAI8387951.1 small subunit of acetolactate synthase-domain-containing protein [Radiomyces spectabilis]
MLRNLTVLKQTPLLRTAARSTAAVSCRFMSSRAEPSATSAMSFKKHLRQRRFGPVPAPPPSVEDAVTNILYNTPAPSPAPETRHILNCLVQNEPGVLSRLSGILAARGFNIESLVVANTEVPDLSRMTVVFNGRNVQIEQARRQLEDLVPVWAVLDYTKTKLIERELLLIKVSILGPEYLHEQLPTARFDADARFEDENLSRHDENPRIPPSETLRETFSHLRALTELTRLFEGRVVDVSSDSVVIEVCAKPGRISSFMKLCKPFGILEASRTGVMAMPRSPVHDHYEPQTEHSFEEENDAVDATMLPPG